MKRLVVCCDGTWSQPDQQASGASCPTNVVKLAALVKPVAGATEQRLLYYPGIGSEETAIRKWVKGATGLGISKALTECYRWVIRNYAPGDELYLFGFSRGAYTARSLAGFIRNSGILRPEHEDLVPRALALYRSRDRRTHPRAIESRSFRRSYARADVSPIRCIAVWDTVGALGVPNTMVQGILKHVFRLSEFHDTELSSKVSYAFHAIAIDERRHPFLPTLWVQNAEGVGANQHLEQVWFAGCHSDVGGGTRTSQLSDVALDWMLDRARLAGLNLATPGEAWPPDFPAYHPSPLGPIHETLTLFYRLFFPSGVRQIGSTEELTHEAISDAAWIRWNAVPTWRPKALVRYAEKNPGELGD